MSFTVREALELPQLKGAGILAGKSGSERTIEHVTVMDAPDAINWLRGGELVLTTAYVMREDPVALLDFVKRLAKTKAAALGIKLGRFIDNISDEIKDFADKAGFPIINIPFEVAWIDVITPVLTEVVERQASILKRSMDIHTQFIDSVISGGEMADVMRLLSSQIGSLTCVTDMKGNVIASSLKDDSKDEGERAEWERMAKAASGQEAVSEPWEMFPGMYRIIVKPSDGKPGYTLIEALCGQDGTRWGKVLALEEQGRAFTRMDAISISHAVTVASLEMLRIEAAENVERRFRSSFWDDFLNGRFENWEDIVKRGRSFSVDLTSPNVLLAISADGEKPGQATQIGSDGGLLQDEIIRLTTQYGTRFWGAQVTCFAYMGGAAVIAPWTGASDPIEAKKRSMELAEHLHAKVDAAIAPFTVSIGVGRFDPDPQKAGRSYKEAYECIAVGSSMLGSDRVSHFDELGAYRVFSRCTGREEMARFAAEELAPLEEYDTRHNTELLFTLEKYLDAGGSLQQAADSTYVHVNTLRYRLGRIEAILGSELSDSEVRFTLSMAIRIRKYLSATR
ncbi:MAG TPA: PucR family transcriptional regulator ligand-binding domain-containing protein [Bacillota bacterium]|nr:PucR family transcriptional regulator ligand-binding domain-containing protein [Bacillota bacterium]